MSEPDTYTSYLGNSIHFAISSEGLHYHFLRAPEFHVIGGELYILFAVSGEVWGPQAHVMQLKKGGNILNIHDWEDPIRVRRQEGTYLADGSITLDMTYFMVEKVAFVAWSERNTYRYY